MVDLPSPGLDDVMRALWRRYGRDFYSPKAGATGIWANFCLAIYGGAEARAEAAVTLLRGALHLADVLADERPLE